MKWIVNVIDVRWASASFPNLNLMRIEFGAEGKTIAFGKRGKADGTFILHIAI